MDEEETGERRWRERKIYREREGRGDGGRGGRRGDGVTGDGAR